MFPNEVIGEILKNERWLLAFFLEAEGNLLALNRLSAMTASLCVRWSSCWDLIVVWLFAWVGWRMMAMGLLAGWLAGWLTCLAFRIHSTVIGSVCFISLDMRCRHSGCWVKNVSFSRIPKSMVLQVVPKWLHTHNTKCCIHIGAHLCYSSPLGQRTN